MKRKEYFSLVMGLGMLIYFTGIAPAQSVSVAPAVDRACERETGFGLCAIDRPAERDDGRRSGSLRVRTQRRVGGGGCDDSRGAWALAPVVS
jgi:hypothetical protein